MLPIEEESERKPIDLIPATFTDWDEGGGDYGDIQFYQVEFTEEFGPWKKGQRVQALAFYLSKCLLREYKDGEEVMSINVKLIPIIKGK